MWEYRSRARRITSKREHIRYVEDQDKCSSTWNRKRRIVFHNNQKVYGLYTMYKHVLMDDWSTTSVLEVRLQSKPKSFLNSTEIFYIFYVSFRSRHPSYSSPYYSHLFVFLVLVKVELVRIVVVCTYVQISRKLDSLRRLTRGLEGSWVSFLFSWYKCSKHDRHFTLTLPETSVTVTVVYLRLSHGVFLNLCFW